MRFLKSHAILIAAFVAMTSGCSSDAMLSARKKHMEIMERFYHMHFVDRYEKMPEAEWKADALSFVRESAYWHSCRGRDCVHGDASPLSFMMPEYYETADMLVKRGCDWPYVRMQAKWKGLGAEVGMTSAGFGEKITRFCQDLMVENGVTALESYLMCETLRQYRDTTVEAGFLSDAFLRLLREVPQDDDSAVALWALLENTDLTRGSAAMQKILDSGFIRNEWFRLMVEGTLLLRKAWNRRGGGYADMVTKDRWADYHALRKEADSCLTEAERMIPDVPYPHFRLLKVSLGNARECRRQMDAIIKIDPEYAAAYSTYRFSCRPRWCGSISKMIAFGDEMFAKGEPGSVMQLQYVFSRLDVAEELGYRWMDAFRDDRVCSNMAFAVESAMKRKDVPSLTKQYLHQTLIYPAYARGDYRRMGEIAKCVWSNVPMLKSVSDCAIGTSLTDFMKTIGLAFAGPECDELAMADQAYRAGRLAEAKERFSCFLSSQMQRPPKTVNTNALEYAAAQIIVVDRDLVENSGGSYSLMPRYAPRFNRFSFWKTYGKAPSLSPRGWKVGSSTCCAASLRVLLDSGAIEIMFRPLKMNRFILGLNIGEWNDVHPTVGNDGSGTCAMMCAHTKGKLHVSKMRSCSPRIPVALPMDSDSSLKLLFDGRKYRTFINGNEIPDMAGRTRSRIEDSAPIISASNVQIKEIRVQSR